MNQPTTALKACHLVLNEVSIVKPLFRYYFLCLKQLKILTLGVVYKTLEKIMFDIFLQNGDKKLFIFNFEKELLEIVRFCLKPEFRMFSALI